MMMTAKIAPVRISRIADPVAEVVQQLEDPLFEVGPANGAEAARAFVDQQIFNDVLGNSLRMDFDQFDQSCGNHGEPSVTKPSTPLL